MPEASIVVGSGTAPATWRARRSKWTRVARRVALLWCASGVVGLVSVAGDRPVGPPERGVAEWLVRLQQATSRQSYMGTFVVSSPSGALSSSRIWHVCEGDVQLERVDALTGTPRTTLRRNESVMTFLPQSRTVRTEERDAMGVFPNLLTPGQDFATAEYYHARQVGQGRVAGHDADIVLLRPRDDKRFGYRIWSEQRTGLVVMTQTLDARGQVLEQAAFSELRLDVPAQAEPLQQMMAATDGYRIERAEHVRSSPEAEGWRLKAEVAGFRTQQVYRRKAPDAVQWIFSDGLATVSLFLEPFDARRHGQAGAAAMGATHTLSRRVPSADGGWWVTAVGEVPARTLQAFADNLERRN